MSWNYIPHKIWHPKNFLIRSNSPPAKKNHTHPAGLPSGWTSLLWTSFLCLPKLVLETYGKMFPVMFCAFQNIKDILKILYFDKDKASDSKWQNKKALESHRRAGPRIVACACYYYASRILGSLGSLFSDVEYLTPGRPVANIKISLPTVAKTFLHQTVFNILE